MPRKKITEPEGMEQAGLTGENVDSAAVPDETGTPDGFPADTPADGTADAIPEETPPPSAPVTEIVGAESYPPDTGEPLWNVPPVEEPLPPQPEAKPAPAPVPEKTDRQAFFDLNFNELDRGTGPADHVLRRGGSLPGADRDSRLGDVGGRPGAAGFRSSEHGRGQH